MAVQYGKLTCLNCRKSLDIFNQIFIEYHIIGFRKIYVILTLTPNEKILIAWAIVEYSDQPAHP